MKIQSILIAASLVLCSGSAARAASKNTEEAQSFYDRGMKVYAVDPGASLDLFIKAAKKGNIEAMVRLGYCFQTGTGTPVMPKAALNWYTKAAKAGNIAALYEIGSIYETGLFKIAPDYAKALEWFGKGISNHSLKSCEALTRICASCDDPEFHDGEKAVYYAAGLRRIDARNAAYFDLAAAAYARNLDFNNAVKAASQAIALSSLEDAPGRRERKENYENGIPFPPVASNAWILKAAANNNMWAMLQLADRYDDNLATTYDPAIARAWYEKAAEDGSAEALLQLGNLCFQGQGGDVDFKKAFWCYSKAASAGNEDAYGPLARMYVGGRGTHQDFDQAIEWYQKAVDADLREYNFHLRALKNRQRILKDTSPEDLYAAAQKILTDKTPNDKGEVPTFSQKTWKIMPLYWLAAEQGHLESMKKMGDLYFYGKHYFVRQGEVDQTTGGVGSDYRKALDYYHQLSRRGIECPEQERCAELYRIELKEQREKMQKKEHDKKRMTAKEAAESRKS
ncbi:tetratricopeptide repeat protein [Pontiellaceae bacterium B1224]|nr:tetratricopeptide repeat protein [Pontiellaceae bacterium B1224]